MKAPLTVSCPNCGQTMKVKSRALIGKKACCRSCAEVFVLEPDAGDSIVPPATGSEQESDAELEVVDDLLWDESALPPKPPVKKKKRPETPAPAKSRWRDEAGRLPLAIQFLLMGMMGILLGLAAMGLWSAVVWLSGARLGSLAILVGVGVGIGVCLAAGDRIYGRAPSLLAGSVAAMMLTVSQVAATIVQQGQHQREFEELRSRVLPVLVSDDGMKRMYADEVLASRKEQDIEVDWSDVDKDLREATDEELLDHPELFEAIYPADVWDEAEQLFEGTPTSDLQAKRTEIRQQWEQGPKSIGPETKRYLALLKLQPQKFTGTDLLFYLASIMIAYLIAARLNRKPRPTFFQPWQTD